MLCLKENISIILYCIIIYKVKNYVKKLLINLIIANMRDFSDTYRLYSPENDVLTKS